MTSKYSIQWIFCMIICAGCADSNSAQPNGLEDGGSGSVTGTAPVTASGSTGTTESTGGRTSSGGTSVSRGGVGSVSVGSGASITPPPSGGAMATGGATGNCIGVAMFCTQNSECCNNNCVDGYCYEIRVSTGGQSATGGRSATGGSSGTAGTDLVCLALGELCSPTGIRQCCKSTQYQVVCSGTCQYAAVAITGGSSSQ